MFSMTGYVLVESKFMGRTMTPQIAVCSSLPNDVKTSGGRHPVARRALASACSSSDTTLPSLTRRSCMTGGRSTREYRSTKY